MGISNYEKETIIIFNEEEQEARIETFKPTFKKKLDKLCLDYPELYKRIKEGVDGGNVYLVPKRYIRVGSPRTVSEEQRKAMTERAKARWSNKENQEEDSE